MSYTVVGEDVGEERVGLSVEDHCLPDTRVDSEVSYHLPDGRDDVCHLPRVELSEVLPEDGLQQRLLPAPPGAQQGGDQPGQDVSPQTGGGGEGCLVVQVEPGGRLQPLALGGGQQDRDGPGVETAGAGGFGVHQGGTPSVVVEHRGEDGGEPNILLLQLALSPQQLAD